MGLAINNAVAVPGESQAEERVHPIVRVLPSLTDIIVIVTIVFLFTCMQGTHALLGDGDTGWHIRTGQWILTHHQIPRQDIFSYTVPGKPWFAWEWLWDVTFACIYNRAGLAGVVLVSLVVLSVTMALLFRLTRRRSRNVLVAFVITTVAVTGSSLHWLARPHLFTLLFGVIFYSILERVKDAQETGQIERARRLLWTLPVLSILWTNFHGGFLLGIILTGCYGAGELAGWLVDPAGRGALARARRYFLACGGCLLVSVINPYFLGLHVHILSYLRDSYTYENIMEFQSISFHSAMAWTLEGMIVLGAIAAYREVRRKQFIYVFLFVAWAHLALISGRNIPIFMLVAAPIVASHLAEMLSSLADSAAVAPWLRRAAASVNRLAADVDETDRIPRLHLVSVAALALVAAIVLAPAPPDKFRPEYDTKRYPADALKFLGGAGIRNRIFTDDEWGDYLLYTLYPTKVFIDGRSDMYGDKFCEEYIELMGVKYDWQQTLDKYSVDTVLLSTKAPLAGALKESHNWRVVYDDGVAIVFRPAALRAVPGEKVSAAPPDSGTGRDRRITKSQKRDLRITKTTT